MDSPTSVTISTPTTRALELNQDWHKKWWTGNLHRVLSMEGGEDEGSYAKNSEAPASAIVLCKPLLLTAIHSMKLFLPVNGEYRDSFRIADLGCATGYNTLSTVDMIVQNLRQRYKQDCGFEPEFEAFFSDLPSNDFNSLFRTLDATASDRRRGRSPYFAAGVPGSFYQRLFPKEKIHVAVSLNALHWLSQIPEEVLDKSSPAWNKGRAWIDGAKEEVVEAFAKQSEEDLDNFLRCRKEEIVQGGILFLLMGGRPSSLCLRDQFGDPDTKAKHPFTTSMDEAWQDLVDEGLIDEETRDGFNIPAYMRSTEEVERGIRKCGGFEIQKVEYKRLIEHSKEKQQEWISDPVSYGKHKANLVRAGLRPIIQAHLGPSLSEELFKRYEDRAASNLPLLYKTCFYGVIVVFAIRK